VHLRRALLLFAIVLGLAALATSVSGPSREDDAERRSEPPQVSEASPGPGAPGHTELRLEGRRGKRRAALEEGQAATLVVPVTEPGQVELPELGLTSSGAPLTPASFELIGDERGSYAVTFRPADSDEPRTLGKLIVG
jgi:hypothetical protein